MVMGAVMECHEDGAGTPQSSDALKCFKEGPHGRHRKKTLLGKLMRDCNDIVLRVQKKWISW